MESRHHHNYTLLVIAPCNYIALRYHTEKKIIIASSQEVSLRRCIYMNLQFPFHYVSPREISNPFSSSRTYNSQVYIYNIELAAHDKKGHSISFITHLDGGSAGGWMYTLVKIKGTRGRFLLFFIYISVGTIGRCAGRFVWWFLSFWYSVALFDIKVVDINMLLFVFLLTVKSQTSLKLTKSKCRSYDIY